MTYNPNLGCDSQLDMSVSTCKRSDPTHILGGPLCVLMFPIECYVGCKQATLEAVSVLPSFEVINTKEYVRAL